jgi:5-methyltetrahydrofolate--homocysteine methyltransferase
MKKIENLIQEKILILDGATGTSFQKMGLTSVDFGGEQYVGCNEYLVLASPDAVCTVHESYLQAGADIVETNTFGANSIVLAEYGLESMVFDINFQAVQIARKACAKYSTIDKPRFVAGSMGPTTKSLSVTGGISFLELSQSYEKQVIPLVKAGVDYLLIETIMDSLNLKAAYIGMLNAFEKLEKSVPFAISVTIEESGKTLAGQDIVAFYASCEHMNPLYIGINCAVGPDLMKGPLQALNKVSKFPISLVPNAGMPNDQGKYDLTEAGFAEILGKYMKDGLVNVVGGCCGTTPAHIQLLSKFAYKPQFNKTWELNILSGVDSLVIEPEKCYVVGERANVIGSRIFKGLISDEKFEEAAEIAKQQIKAGADIIDICVSNPDRDEKDDIESLLGFVSKFVKVPLMIDSQSAETVEAGFQLIQGKCVLNSVNLENNGQKMKELMPLVQRYGASVVVGCIKEEMALTSSAKLEIAKEAYKILTEQYGLAEPDIIFDSLVFPCATGEKSYIGSAKETIEGIKLIKKQFPKCKTILGVSNVSFGLPILGREVLNARFLQLAKEAGLDFAIVNAEKTIDKITKEQAQLCDDLLFSTNKTFEPALNRFLDYFRNKDRVISKISSELTIEQKLKLNILEGYKKELEANLEGVLKKYKPIDVINNILMTAMAEVGELFNKNELIVAEVLRSAEVMKAAIDYLQQFLSKEEIVSRGCLLLATVKGDVHDIGKNLVDIILSNNGFKVIDIGIKKDPEAIYQACLEFKPDIIGLSGLLVQSGVEMIAVVNYLNQHGISIPLMIGGAAISEKFVANKLATVYKGDVFYCKDAMSGLSTANSIVSGASSTNAIEKVMENNDLNIEVKSSSGDDNKRFKSRINHNQTVMPSNFEKQIISLLSEASLVEEVMVAINKKLLFSRHLGFKGNYEKKLALGDEKTIKLVQDVDAFFAEVIQNKLIKPTAIFQFFKPEVVLAFCINEEIKALVSEQSSICLFVASCGQDISEQVEALKQAGEYFKALLLYALSLEAVEALTEIVHSRIRQNLKIGPESGFRISPGYKAWPDLADQQKIWQLLEPGKNIGVTLTENNMMKPEAAVSGMIIS